MILVCPFAFYMQMLLETACSGQSRFIGQSLSIGEHGIGYSNLAFKAEKDWYSVSSPWLGLEIKS